jgi:hypothetical protein
MIFFKYGWALIGAHVPKELSGNVMQTKECMILPIYFISI